MKAVVLLSGGIDSTTCLALAVERYGADEVFALTAYYGQKHMKELKAAKSIAEYYHVGHTETELSDLFRYSDCPLLFHSEKSIKHESYADQIAKTGKVDTYVPFRNGLFLSYATIVAVSFGAEVIMYGAHADDAAGHAYPDGTPEFVEAMQKAIYEGSGKVCKLQTPFLGLPKSEVVRMGLSLKAPYHLTWSCYEGGDKPCGECGTCLDRKRAFKVNGVHDPALEV